MVCYAFILPMKYVLKKYFLTLSSIFILSQFIPSIVINNSWNGLFYASLILSLLFYLIRPLINLIMIPINLITLNLSSWIVNIIIFYIWTIITSTVKISNWQFGGLNTGAITLSPFNLVKWQVIIVGALVYIFINKFLEWVFK